MGKEELYRLIDMYTKGQIDEVFFCDAFVPAYEIELDHDQLTEKENIAFCELSRVAARFSEFEEDHQQYPGVFNSKKDVKKKILETLESLSKYS